MRGAAALRQFFAAAIANTPFTGTSASRTNRGSTISSLGVQFHHFSDHPQGCLGIVSKSAVLVEGDCGCDHD